MRRDRVRTWTPRASPSPPRLGRREELRAELGELRLQDAEMALRRLVLLRATHLQLDVLVFSRIPMARGGGGGAPTPSSCTLAGAVGAAALMDDD